jgi:hypothetical protein
MSMKTNRRRLTAIACVCLAWTASAWSAEGTPAGEAPAGADAQQAAAPAARQLAIHQGAIADKYTKLEKLLEDMARIEAVTDPRRAALLMKALELSKENLTGVKLDRCVKSLEQFDAKNRAEREGLLGLQRETHQDMKTLLELLLSENRSDRLKREQDRIREYIKEVERILRLQKSVQGRTEGGGELDEMAKDQDKIAERTDELAKQIRDNEEGGSQQQEQSGAEGQTQGQGQQPGREQDQAQPKPDEPPQDAPPQDDGQSQDDGQAKGKDSAESPPKGKLDGQGPPQGQKQEPGAGKELGQKKDPSQGDSQGKSGPSKDPPSEGQGQQDQGEAQPQDQQEQDGSPPQDEDNPARKRLEAARQRMREAQKKLEEAQRQEAVAEQEKAKEELERAKAELERILRQMREEEVERVLALLESRFRKMLEIQVRIYEDTVRLGNISEAERDLKVPIPAGKLAIDQRKLVVEADKALNLLLEEGSSVAFPETVTQMREDMQQVADRLDAAKVEEITQGIEQDIIAALQEMIEALQKAQKDLEKQQQQQQQAQPGQGQDMPLVDAIGELKMIRALQMRVNMRTQRYARLLDDIEDPVGQATDRDLREALTKLAERQETIYRLTRDIVLGKNK